MVEVRTWSAISLMSVAVAAACGGESRREGEPRGAGSGGSSGHAAGGPSTGGTGASDGGADTGGDESGGTATAGLGGSTASAGAGAGGTSASGGASGAGGASGSSDQGVAGENAGGETSYVPEGPPTTPEGDGRLEEGGSFETNAGFGWDLCPARVPGLTLLRTNEGMTPAHGERYLSFQPPTNCEEQCREEGSDAQIAFYFDEPLPAREPLYLYFDSIDFAAENSSGVLSFASLDWLCETAELLAEIPLEDLALQPSWATRCVELQPTEETSVLGLYVTGENYWVGMDTFRFGRPCR
jgi:hypothetical protein